jgi:hypothetical protein
VFVRLELGLGPAGFSENTALLDDMGYGGVKLWTTLDGAYMFHPNVGAGLWMGLNRRGASPQGRASLNEVAYFIGAQLPVKLVGKRALALHLTPRAGFASGDVTIDNGIESEAQGAFIWGGGLNLNSFKYHIGGGVSLMRAVREIQSPLALDHDYGGLYFHFGGTVDG